MLDSRIRSALNLVFTRDYVDRFQGKGQRPSASQTREQFRIVVRKETAGNVADRIQARNDVLLFIQNLHLIVDLQTVAGAQQTGAQPNTIERRFAQL